MKDAVLYSLLLVLISEGVYLVINRNSRQVLSEKASVVITSTLTPIPTSTLAPTIKPTPKPTIKPTPTVVPQPMYTSEQINGFIDRFAAQYNVDPNVLRHIALCESGFNQSASNMGYAGLFQFGVNTWRNLRNEIGEDPDPNLRFNAEEATQTAASALGKGKYGLWPNCKP